MIYYYLFKEAGHGTRKVSQKEFANHVISAKKIEKVQISSHEFDIKFYDYNNNFIGWQEIVAL